MVLPTRSHSFTYMATSMTQGASLKLPSRKRGPIVTDVAEMSHAASVVLRNQMNLKDAGPTQQQTAMHHKQQVVEQNNMMLVGVVRHLLAAQGHTELTYVQCHWHH